MKVSSFVDIDGVSRTMIQMIDITSNLKYQDQKSKNKILAMVNSCVSHELRNPLNVIKGLNLEKKQLLQSVQSYVLNEDFSKETLVSKLKLVIQKMIKNQ
jgi:signal transduction histidine kinase